ncbi:hypothetical protein AVEN_32658-1 [Araneus ventricosus]|uniref:Uncharacterized protein n=1 Tax=Araneus ventricosus TaxID=182803 RepID=A0A4Y2C7J6_ARAVE|nr:hypothetical protein AVEN_32658-1 [Araneus ventricosus]
MTKSYTLLCGLLSLQWFGAILGTITPARIRAHVWWVIRRSETIHRWYGLLDHQALIHLALIPHRACVDMLGRQFWSQCAARASSTAPTSLTTGMGITATTSDQRHYCRHTSPLSKPRYFSWGIIPVIGVSVTVHILPTNLG